MGGTQVGRLLPKARGAAAVARTGFRVAWDACFGDQVTVHSRQPAAGAGADGQEGRQQATDKEDVVAAK